MRAKAQAPQLERIADRLDSKANDINLRSTISEHQRRALVGYLRSEAGLIRELLKGMR